MSPDDSVDRPPDVPRAGQIHHVVVNVRNLDDSLAFYRDALGLQLDATFPVGSDEASTFARIPRGVRGRNALLSAGHGMGRVELVEWEQFGEAPPRRTGVDLGVAIVSFLVRPNELDAMYERVGADYVCWSEPLTIDVGGNAVRAFVVEDPDGVPIEFFAMGESG
jgi:catechol 2,3-dioxygenase-like lactoylglutathione lyase family enzyme